MIKIMKIILAMKMMVTIKQINTCSKSTIEKTFWCLYDKLWKYFTLCSSVFSVDFKQVIVHRVVFPLQTSKILSVLHWKCYFSSSKFFKEISLNFSYLFIIAFSRAKTDLHNKYIFHFKFGWIFEQDHQLNFRSLCEKMI